MRRSTGRFYGFCAVVFALGLAASAYLNFTQYQRAQDRHQLDQETITQLKNEANLVKTATSATPTPGASVLGAKTIKVSELGISIVTLNPLADLTYQFQQLNGLDGINLTSDSLIKSTTTCGPGALGRLVRQSIDGHQSVISGTLIKQLGDYNYYYQPSKTICAKDPVSTAALKADNSILPAILMTLTTS